VIGAISAELLKLRKSWSTWILGGVLVLGLLLLGYLLIYLLVQNPPSGGDGGAERGIAALKTTLLPENVVPNVLGFLSSLGGPIALVIGALNSAREYSLRTITAVLTQRPSRLGLLGAKTIALAIVLGILVVACFAVGVLGSLLVAALDGTPGSVPAIAEIGKGAAASWLILGAWAALGFALGMVLRSTGLAIGLGLVYALVVETVIAALGFALSAFETFSHGLLGPNAQALAASFGQLNVGGGQGGAPVNPPATAALVLAAYVIGSLVVAAILFIRRDVT
jgi:ABC-2 type transport system permease protein